VGLARETPARAGLCSYQRRSLVLQAAVSVHFFVSLDSHRRKINGSDCVSGDSPIPFL